MLDSDGAQTGISIVTVASGLKIVVTQLSVTVDNACSVDVACRIAFSTSTTMPTASTTGVNGVLLAHAGIAAGSGQVIGSGSGIIGIGADDEDLRYTCEDPVGGSLNITVSYYTIET